MEPRSHVIVGDGITALAFLETCARRNLTQVTVIGKSATQIGRGIAYAKGEEGVPWRYAYLLNSPADDIDPVFASWLADNWKAVETKMAGRRPDWLSAAASLVAEGDIYGVNAPREFYGDYMEDRARNIIASLADKSIEVRLVDDIATSLETTDDGVCLHTKAGQIIRAQSADIAPGGPDTMRFDGDDGPFSVPSVFGHEHRVVEHVRNGAEVFCIGGNAAMLDVLRLCQSVIPDEQLKFTFCAPEGEIPPPLVPRLPRKLTKPNLTKGHASAESFLLQVRREIDAAEARGENRREIRAGFRAHFLGHPLSKYVSDTSDAAQVARKLRFWLRGGTRDTIFDMRVLAQKGHVKVLKGRVLRIETTSSGAIVAVETDDGKTSAHATGFVVNCAGAGPASKFDALTEDMLQNRHIRRSSGGGLVVNQSCQTDLPNVKYLSPSVTQIGDEVMAMPLYDAHMLRTYVARSAVGV